MTYFPLRQTTCFFIPLVAPCKPLLAYNNENPSDAFIKPTFANYLVVAIIVVIAVVVTIQTEIEQLVIELNSIDDRDNEILGTKIEEAKEESVIPSKPCCPNCGSECDVSAKFCRKCGYKLQ